jgi:hypothetical protein
MRDINVFALSCTTILCYIRWRQQLKERGVNGQERLRHNRQAENIPKLGKDETNQAKNSKNGEGKTVDSEISFDENKLRCELALLHMKYEQERAGRVSAEKDLRSLYKEKLDIGRHTIRIYARTSEHQNYN